MRKQFTTKMATNYSIVLEKGKPNCIIVEDAQKQVYYFNPAFGQMPVTDKLLKEALQSLLASNPTAFDILSICLEKPEYYDIAIEAFKEYWNVLYNLGVANDVFKRYSSDENIKSVVDCCTRRYDYFVQNK